MQGRAVTSAVEPMKHVALALLVTILLAVVGGGIFVTLWDFPVPRQQVESTIPNARFFGS